MKKFGFLLSQLVDRDFKTKYRGSILGVLWSVLNPLLTMMVLSVVFSQVFNTTGDYKMYLLSGLIIFNYFSEATSAAVDSVVGNFSLLSKVYFPKFILPLSKIFSSAINFVISIVIFTVLNTFSGASLWWGYFFALYACVCVMIFACGIAFIVSALQVFFRDVKHLYGVLLMIWMYSTPILYPIDIISDSLQPFFKMNPLYIMIDFLRTITLHTQLPEPSSFLMCSVSALLAFAIGGIFFVKVQDQFIYYN